MTIEMTRPLDTAAALPLEIDAHAADLLFREAHTVYDFSDEPVSDAQVEAAYELLRWAPTAFNSSPLRLLLVRSPEARERLVTHLSPGNRPKALSAPLTIVAAADTDFHRHLGTLAPHMTDGEATWEQQPEARAAVSRTSALLQVGYLLLALRAAGLHVGPMAGFDAEGIDREFFSEDGRRTLLVVNVGQPAASENATRPRSARLGFDQVAQQV